MAINVIDVSEHNGVIDWAQVKAAGYHAIIRCGYGMNMESQDDDYWKRNADECTRLGIPFGVYLYSYADSEAKARSEAEHVLRCIKGYKLSYPVYYDVEEDRLATISKRHCEIFCDIVEKAGYWAGVYANEYWWNNYLKGLDRWTKWVAKWSSKQPIISGMGLWQYTDAGGVAGVKGKVDCNKALVDFPALIGQPQNPAPNNPSTNANIDELVKGVFEGRYGDGEQRKQALGSSYDAVQARVNEVYKLAQRTINGDFGNGEARKKALGNNYEIVQFVVNKIV